MAQRLELQHLHEEGRLSISVPNGRIEMVDGQLSLSAADPRTLFSLQQMVIGQVGRAGGEVDLDWETLDVGAIPPNFSMAEVIHRREISANFVRVRLALEDIDRFGPDSLHFRLVISAQEAGSLTTGSILSLPRISEKGAVDWPQGNEALHRPVYTLTEVNTKEGWLDFDIYRHEGGRVTAWAEVAKAGDIIGLMGPTLLRRDLGPWVGLYGDETALPAIRLYLRSLAPDTEGEAVITLRDMRDAQELPHPAGMRLSYLPWRQAALLDAVRAAPFSADHGYLYAGCERAEADDLRRHARDTLGLPKARMNITSFWTAP